MKNNYKQIFKTKLITAAIVSSLLAGCNSGGSLNTAPKSSPINKKPQMADPTLYKNCLSKDGASEFVYEDLLVDPIAIELGKEICPTYNSNIQNSFDWVVDSIQSFQLEDNTSNLKQPIIVEGINDLETAQQMATFGYKYQEEVLVPTLANICNNLKNSVCKSILRAPSPKNAARVLEKGKGPLKNFDYARSTIVMDYNSIPQFLQTLLYRTGLKNKVEIPFNIQVLKNRLLLSTPGNYRDIQIFVQDQKTGFISEIQIFGPEMEQKKNLESHTLYEEVRRIEEDIKIGVNKSDKEGMEKIVELENKLSRQINDNIFRTDAITSCTEKNIKNCAIEIEPYINKFPEKLSTQLIRCTDTFNKLHEFSVEKFRNKSTDFIYLSYPQQKWSPIESHSVEVVDKDGNFTSAVNFKLLNDTKLSFLNSENGWALEFNDPKTKEKLYYWGNDKCQTLRD